MLNRQPGIAAAVVLVAMLTLSLAEAAAGEGEPPDARLWSGDVRIISTVLTGILTVDRVLSVELVPRETPVRAGGPVVWFNGVPGALLHVVFDSPPPAVEDCSRTSPIRAPYSSGLLRPGDARILCFQRSGIYPYRAVIATADAVITLTGVVVVGE